MKLLLVNDDLFEQNMADKIYNTQICNMLVDIQQTGIDVLKSRYTDVGKISIDELLDDVGQSIFRNTGFIKHTNLETFKTKNCTKDTPNNYVGYEDPELSNVYEDAKIWCIAYDTGFKTIELLENGVYTSKQKAEDVAKEMSDSDMFRGAELTVIGIPIKNIDYGDTFLVPNEEDGLVEISDELFIQLAKQAHKQDMTVNELANTLLKKHIEKEIAKKECDQPNYDEFYGENKE